MFRNLLTTICLALLSLQGIAQDFNTAKLDSFFLALNTHSKFMGGVALSQNGRLIYTRSAGFADLETGQLANQNSKYRIGSISKTFTTVLVMKAVEEKKLKLDQTIKKYFPSIPNADKITIEQLLYHRSGIHNFTDDASYAEWYTQPKTEDELVTIIANGGSDFPPDSMAQYSNSNFVLLSYILIHTYKKTYGELLEEKITKPLALTNTYFGGKIDPLKNECSSYQYSAGWVKVDETDMSIPQGAGSIVSTPTDMTTFIAALFEGKLISAESLEQMKTVKDEYGMGLIPLSFYEYSGYGHTGGIDAFNAFIMYIPGDSLSFALTSNGSNYNDNEIANVVLSSFYDMYYDIPQFKSIVLTAEDLVPYLGVYSSMDTPIKITITNNGNTLMAQGTDQAAFSVEASDVNIFTQDKIGLVMEFNPGEKQLIVKQGGGVYTFYKE